MAETHTDNDRLDSWKEIAAYLNRNERTVSRWEKRGLPVYRVPGAQRQMVFAYKHELDAWLKQGKNGKAREKPLATAEPPSAGLGRGSPQEHQPVPRAPHFGRRGFVLALTGGCLVTVVLGLVLVRSRSAATVHPLKFTRLTDDERGKGNLRTDGATLYFNENRGARAVLVARPTNRNELRLIDTPLFSNALLQDLSNDGTTLLVTSLEGIAREGPLWAIATVGGTPKRIGDVLCIAARYSPDNRRIACAAWNTVIIMDADGAHSRTLTSFVSPVVQAVWTPDGMRLRVTLEENTPNSYTPWEVGVTAEGTEPPARKLPLGTNCCFDWTWIQGGMVAVYVRVDHNGKRHVVTAPEKIPFDGTGETELPVSVGDVLGLAAMRTGHDLYLVTSNTSHGELWKFDARIGEFKTFLTGISGAYVAYSPDGNWITYASTEDGSLFRSRADGTDVVQLTQPPMYTEVSSWSPDGRRIAFMGRVPGQTFRIYLIGRDGGAIQEAADGDDSQGGPSWSPDGVTLVYGNVLCEEMRDCWIRRLDLTTRKTEIVQGSHGFRTARWSPDGKHIAAFHLATHRLMLFDVATERWHMLADAVTGDNINWSRDSRSVFVDRSRDRNPAVEMIRIRDGARSLVCNLAPLERVPEQINNWMGLAPDNSPILLRVSTVGAVYALEWKDH